MPAYLPLERALRRWGATTAPVDELALLDALEELPPRTRQVFVLCRIEGMRQKGVAKRLGVSVSAIEKHMIKAIAHLSMRLEPS